jgi:hypothetical protein
MSCKIGLRTVKYIRMPMDHERSLKQLKEALQAHHHALEELESAIVEFEESISEEATLFCPDPIFCTRCYESVSTDSSSSGFPAFSSLPPRSAAATNSAGVR